MSETLQRKGGNPKPATPARPARVMLDLRKIAWFGAKPVRRCAGADHM
jgi:hypothetical protein